VRLEEPGLRLTRRQALTGLGGLGAAALLVTGCTARNPAGHGLTTAATVNALVPGTLLWRVRAPAGIVSLVATDSLVFAGVDDSSGTFGGVYAMHAGTGQKAWTQYGDVTFAPYAVERDVLFGVGLDGVGALNATSGKVLWRAPAGTVNPVLASTWVLVTGGTVCTISDLGSIPKSRGVVLGLDSSNGRRKWVADIPPGGTVLTGAGRLVFTASPVPPFNGSGRVVALDAATGQRRWTSANLHMVPGQIAATQDVVTVSTSDSLERPGRYLTIGLDSATGRELWRIDGSADPLIAGGGLVYGVGKTLWARDARTSRVVWEHAFGQHAPVILALTGGTVLASSARKVQALSAATGEGLWSQAIPAYPGGITTAAGKVYVPAASDPLAQDGGTNWIYAFQA